MGIRRVRTPEGARWFGQPIGSIIVRDVIPNLPSRRTKKPRKTKFQASVEASVAAARAKQSAGKYAETDINWKMKPTGSGGGTGYIDADSIDDPTSFRWKFQKMLGTYRVYAGSRAPNGATQFQFGRLGEYESLEDALEAVNRFESIPEAKRVERDVDSYWDYREGVYGVDWLDEDDIYDEGDWDDPVLREQMAKKESDRLGIEVVPGQTVRGRTTTVNLNLHEEINTTMRAYENMYPGFTRFLKTFRVGLEQFQGNMSGALAWNGARFYNSDSPTVIGFNNKYFEDDSYMGDDSVYQKIVEYSARSGWFSISPPSEIAKAYEREEWEVGAQIVLNHEIGHTVARMIFGEMGWNNYYDQGTEIQLEQADYWADTVGPILYKYGVINDMDVWEQLVDTSNPEQTRVPGYFPITMNKDALSRHLSKYGATNLHEMMAETWAAYMTDPTPTEFALELGRAMEELLVTFMDEYEEMNGPYEIPENRDAS